MALKMPYDVVFLIFTDLRREVFVLLILVELLIIAI